MKNKKLNIILLLIFWLISIYISYKISYSKGFDDGSTLAIEYLNTMLKKQIENDTTTITKIKVIPKDTIYYELSSKKLYEYKK